MINEYQFQTGGQVEFEIPTDGASELVWNILDRYGLITRVFGAEFSNGVLGLKNKLREDAPIPYYWSPEANCYQIEYYYNDLFICGPADPDSYLMSLSWWEFNRSSAKEAKTDQPEANAIACAGSCVQSDCDPAGSGYPYCKDCSFCQEDDNDEGEADNSYGVPDDSTTTSGGNHCSPCDSDGNGIDDCTETKSTGSRGNGDAILGSSGSSSFHRRRSPSRP